MEFYVFKKKKTTTATPTQMHNILIRNDKNDTKNSSCEKIRTNKKCAIMLRLSDLENSLI